MGKKSREKAARRDKVITRGSVGQVGAGAASPARPPSGSRTAEVSRTTGPPVRTAAPGTAQQVRRLLSEGNAPAALALLQESPPSSQGAAEHRNLVARSLVQLHQYSQAFPLLKAAAAEGNLSLEMNQALVETQANLGMYVHMERLVRRLSQAYPNHPFVIQARSFLQEHRREREQQAAEIGADLAQLEEAMYLVESTYSSFREEELPEVIGTLRRAVEISPRYTPAQISLATALIVGGDVEGAISTLQALAKEPNTAGAQAGASLARLYVSLGRREEANSLAAALLEMPSSTERRHWVAEALTCVDDHAALRDLLRGARDLSPRERFLLGAANAQLNELPSARRELHAALDAGYNPPLVVRVLEGLDNGKTEVPYIPALEMASPRAAMVVRRVAARPSEETSAELRTLLEEEPRFLDLLERALQEDPASAVPILCAAGTPEALRKVQDFAMGQEGSLADRVISLSYLRDAGEIAEDEPVNLIIEGEPQSITLGKHRIIPDRLVELPDEATAKLFQEGIRLIATSPEDAYDRWVAVDRGFPRSVQLRMNLARLSGSLGRPDDSREWIQKALELDPSSVEAHIALAAQCMNEGDIRGAIAAGRFVEEAEVLTVTDLLSYQSIRESLDTILQSPMADALMAQADMAVDEETAEANRELAGMLGSMQKSLALTQYLRQRPIRGLREDISLSDIVQQMDSAVIYNAAWLFGLLPEMEDLQETMAEGSMDDDPEEPEDEDEGEDPRIQQAREELSRRLLDPDLLAEGLPGLPDRDLQGLHWLLDQGGSAPLEDYLKEFPMDEGAPSDMMLEYGIVVEGRLAGKMTRLIPTDLRQPLRHAVERVQAEMAA